MQSSTQANHPKTGISCATAVSKTRVSCAALVLAAGVSAVWALPAFAGPVTGQVGVASEYLGKSDEDPAAFGSIRWQTNGFYVNAFASQAATSKGADGEVIVAVGYQRDIGEWGLDVQVMNRQLLNETNGIDSNYYEVQGDLSRDLTERLSTRFRVNYSANGYGNADTAWWSEIQTTYKLTSKDKVSAAYAVRRVENGTDYDAWNVGVKHKFTRAIAGDLRWYDTDGHDLGSRYDGRLVASISYSF